MLDAALTAQLKTYLETASADRARRLARRQRQVAELRELLDEIAALSTGHRAPDDDDAGVPRSAIDARRHRRRGALRRHPDGPRVHLAGAGAAAGRRPPAQGRGRADRADRAASTASYRVRDLLLAQSCQNCPDVVQALNLMACSTRASHHVAIDGALFQDEVEAAPGHGRADGLPERRAVRPGPHDASSEILAKLDTGAAERDAERARRQGRLRRADRRRRPGRRGGRDLRGAQGHPHRRRRRALRRPGARHAGASRTSSRSRDTEGPKLAAALEQHVQRATTSTS